jgi:hypothetical protein
MLSKEEKDLVEKVVTGGGATGQSMTADPTGSVATPPGNSKKQGDSMTKVAAITPGQGEEETSTETNVKPTGDTSAQNKSSIAMKGSAASAATGSMKEELQQIFGAEVSEDFIVKASALFEAAVALKVDEIEQNYAATLDEEVSRIKDELTEQVDQYLSFTAKEWLKENEVAIETSLKNELTEEFIEGMKALFAEHYMEIPSDKVDVLETLTTKVEELEARLNESLNDKIQLESELAHYEMQGAFDTVSEGLALTQVEKFRTIAENLEFGGDIDAYKKKLEVVKETYFNGDKPAASSNILTEEFDNSDDSSAAPAATGEMSRYVTAISRTLKK